MISSKVKVKKHGKMDHHMKENILMEKNKEGGCLNGAMVICI